MRENFRNQPKNGSCTRCTEEFFRQVSGRSGLVHDFREFRVVESTRICLANIRTAIRKCGFAVHAHLCEGLVQPLVLHAAVVRAVIEMGCERRKILLLAPAMLVNVPVALVGAECASLVTHEGTHVEGFHD